MSRRCICRLVLFGLICLAAAACPSSQDKPEPTKTPNQQKISLQLQWVTQAQFAGYYAALDKGRYQEEGLEVSIHQGGPDVVPVNLVAAGTRDFGTIFLADLAVAIEKGLPVISISQIQQANGLRLLAKKKSGIKSPKDFIGKKVGIWLGSWEAQFNALLSQQKLAQDQIEVVSQGWSMRPFIEGRLDVASAMIYNEYYMVLKAGFQPSELNVIDYADYGLGFPGDVLFTTSKMVNDHPELCTRMVRASLRGWHYALDHQQEAVEIVLKYDQAGIQTREHQLKMMAEIARLVQSPQSQIGSITPEKLAYVTGVLEKCRVLHTPLAPEKIFNPEFVQRVAMKNSLRDGRGD